MNDNQICFITCVNDAVMYEESMRYMDALHIPLGMTVEKIAVVDAVSITQGYHQAMCQSEARYKVYLHQDVMVIHKRFIYDLLALFSAHEKVGMIGVAGAATLPTNGVWWESLHKYGKVYESHTGTMKLLAFHEPQEDYKEVKAIDGLIMATQYDIPWRTDIFTGWHLYDASQSAEFRRAGYQVIVPKQDKPWCIHDCGLVDTKERYHQYRKVFLEEYGKELFPLVSILIPAYNRPHYLEIALKSVLEQEYPHLEVVICDDSTHEGVRTMLIPYLERYAFIRYYKNEGESDALKNFDRCLRLSQGEYINYLMDDDVFHKDKISQMMQYYLEYEDIMLVTSQRDLIDEAGKLLPPINATEKLFDKTVILQGEHLIKLMLETHLNYIGEPTTVLLRKKDIRETFGIYEGKRYYSNIDIAQWLTLLKRGKAVCIDTPLSAMRFHQEQNSKNTAVKIRGLFEWVALLEDSFKNGLICNKEEYKKSLNTWVSRHGYIFKLIGDEVKQRKLDPKEAQKVYACFSQVFQMLLDQ